MNKEHVEELLYQALETEKGGVQHETALKCVVNDELFSRKNGKNTWSRRITTSASCSR